MTPSSQWYLVAYDITNPRRLGRFHRWVRQQMIYFQHSVYIFRITAKALPSWLEEANSYLEADDDLRLYPLRAQDAERLLNKPAEAISESGMLIFTSEEEQ